MSLAERAIKDLQRFSSNSNEFGVEITLTAPDDSTITVNGFSTKHHTGFDEMGIRVNSRISSVAISTELLTGYPYLDANGEVNFSNHKVIAQGENWIVDEYYPDEKLKLIVLILQKYNQ